MAASTWESKGFHENQRAYIRPGKATFSIRRYYQDTVLRGTHANLSLCCGAPPISYLFSSQSWFIKIWLSVDKKLKNINVTKHLKERNLEMGKLENKIAIITGGAAGIGRAAAKLFIQEGAQVMLVDRDESALKSVAAELGETKAAFVVGDVGDPGINQAFVSATIDRFGSIDIALLNAGIEGMIKPIVDYSVDIFDNVIKINVRGVFLGLKAIMPEMRKNGGSIVITSSTGGIRAIGGMSAYVTSKHAVIGLMRTAAVEGAAANIRVNAVNPSPVNTRMISSIESQAGLLTDENSIPPMARHTPLQRYGEPEEVAQLMLFLSSDDSSFCTGGVYMVDGGVSAGRPNQA